MKKRIYFTIIGIGALLAIIGFIPGGMSGIWGVLIAGITGAIYYFNKRNEDRVQERLEGNNQSSRQSEGTAAVKPPVETSENSAAEEEPSSDDSDQQPV